MAVVIESAAITPKPIQAGATGKIAVRLKQYTWDVYAVVKTYTDTPQSEQEEITIQKYAEDGYVFNSATGLYTMNQTYTAYRASASVYIGKPVSPSTATSDIAKLYIARSRVGTSGLVFKCDVRIGVLTSNVKGASVGMVTSFDSADHPANGYEAATDRWYVLRT